jgi:hypothetical protein
MPVVMARARARMTAIFFMAVPLYHLFWTLPEQGKDFRDSHHVLKLFRKKRAACMAGDGRTVTQYICDDRHSAL